MSRCKFVTVIRNGHYVLAVDNGGPLILLHTQAKAGDCYRPGQKMKPLNNNLEY